MPATTKRSASHRLATRTWNRCGFKAVPKPAAVSWWLCGADEFYLRAHERAQEQARMAMSTTYLRPNFWV